MSADLKIFVTLFLAVFVTTMGAGLVAPLLPVYAHDLGAGAFQIGLIFAAFSLTRSLFVPYFGKLSDRKGRKPFLTSGLLTYFLLSLIYAATKTVTTLILLRLAQGFTSAMILPVAQAHSVGMLLGPLIGGLLLDISSFRLVFITGAAIMCIGTSVYLLRYGEPAQKIASYRRS